MKLTYLGTAAAEGFPAVFCNCQYCNQARLLGGKNIRTRSQALINEDLLLDLPADTYGHFLVNGISGHKIRYLLVTHCHFDHFYPMELQMHRRPYAHAMDAPCLQVYCSEGAYRRCSPEPPAGIQMMPVKPFEVLKLGDYEIHALPARHALGEDTALMYIIKGDKTILYAHDTGCFYEEVFAYIQKERFYFDMVSMDCTNVDIPISNTGTHMGIPNVTAVLERLAGMGAVDEKTVKYISHFSHNANPIQENLEARVRHLDYRVAFDSLVVEI